MRVPGVLDQLQRGRALVDFNRLRFAFGANFLNFRDLVSHNSVIRECWCSS